MRPGHPSVDVDGDALRRARNRLGWSQHRLTSACEWTSSARIQGYEAGGRATPKSIHRVAEALGVQPGSLVWTGSSIDIREGLEALVRHHDGNSFQWNNWLEANGEKMLKELTL